jgi:hypothetical protein
MRANWAHSAKNALPHEFEIADSAFRVAATRDEYEDEELADPETARTAN